MVMEYNTGESKSYYIDTTIINYTGPHGIILPYWTVSDGLILAVGPSMS